MRVRFALGVVAVGLAGALGACGGSSGSGATTAGAGGTAGGGGGSTTTSGPTAAEACAADVKARCARLDACTNGHGVAIRFGDEATCEERQQLACEKALGAPDTANTPAKVAECADHVPDELCTDFLDGAPTGPCVPPAGPREGGAPCIFPAQCKSTYCAIPAGAACGACAALPKAGDSCAATGSCGRGLTCGAITRLCVAYAGVDAPCDHDDLPCDRGLSCVGVTKETPKGTCQPAGQAVGMVCDATLKTGAGCTRQVGLFCDAATSQCAEVTYVAPGEPCGQTAAGVFADCLANASCEIPAGAKAGKCVAHPADGAACDTANGPNCLTPARCIGAAVGGGVSGSCTLVDPATCG